MCWVLKCLVLYAQMEDTRSLAQRFRDPDPAVRKVASREMQERRAEKKAARIEAASLAVSIGDNGTLPALIPLTVQFISREGEPTLSAKDLTAKQRLKLFSLAVKALEHELVADTVQGSGKGQRVVPDWPARDRAADKVLSLLGSYPGKAAPVSRPKLPTPREPAWKSRLTKSTE